jgi:hypothetical protein
MQIDQNTVGEEVNAVCIMCTFTYAYWLLSVVSDQCEDDNVG